VIKALFIVGAAVGGLVLDLVTRYLQGGPMP